MKVIYITDFYYDEACGAKTSAHAHLKTLQNLYGSNNVNVIALVGHKFYQYEQGHKIISGDKNRVLLLLHCICGYPTFINKNGVKAILTEIERKNPDVVFIDNSIFGVLIKAIKHKNPSVIVVSYYHDVKAKLGRDWMLNAPWYKKPVYAAMIKNEKLTASLADVNYTLNDRETKLYITAYGKKPEAVLPVYMNVPVPNFAAERKGRMAEEPFKLLFFGGYYLPNVNGIDWFIRNVYPLLNNIELVIAGRGMDKLKDKYQDQHIHIYGEVADLAEPYSDADAVISPIFEGGGMKVKMAEAMAYGKIAIGSDESYEGYSQNIPASYWNHYFFRANTPREYVDAINELKNISGLSKYHSEVREIFEGYYSEQYAEKIIDNSIRKAMEKII